MGCSTGTLFPLAVFEGPVGCAATRLPGGGLADSWKEGACYSQPAGCTSGKPERSVMSIRITSLPSSDIDRRRSRPGRRPPEPDRSRSASSSCNDAEQPNHGGMRARNIRKGAGEVFLERGRDRRGDSHNVGGRLERTLFLEGKRRPWRQETDRCVNPPPPRAIPMRERATEMRECERGSKPQTFQWPLSPLGVIQVVFEPSVTLVVVGGRWVLGKHWVLLAGCGGAA